MNLGHRGNNDEPLTSPDWMLAGFDPGRELFQFAHVTRDTYRDSSFLDHRIRPMPERIITATGGEVDEVLQGLERCEARWIFHTAFCASTLLSFCLDQPGRTLVLREPLVLSHLARQVRDCTPEADTKHGRLSRRVLGVQGRSYPSERAVIKPSNFANRLVPEILGARNGGHDTPVCIYLSCGLHHLLVSILKKQEEARGLMPVFLQSLLRDSDYSERLGLPPVDSLDLLQQSVVFWHCQRHFAQQILRAPVGGNCLAVSMESFFQAPKQTLSKIDDFLGLGLGPDAIDTTVESGAFLRHSKAGTRYSLEQQQAEAREMADRYAGEIESALQWAKPLLRELPIEPFDAGESVPT